MKTKRVVLLFLPEIWYKIRRIALDEGISASELIRRIVNNFLQNS